MDIAELAVLVIPASIGAMGAAVVSLINSRATSVELASVKDELKETKDELNDAKEKQADARKDIIQIGEQLHEARLDNAVMAEAFNQLFNEFRDVTGNKPAVNLERLKHMRTISYITGPLNQGPLEVQK